MNKERLLIVGSTGMLGQALSKVLTKENMSHAGIARKNADFCLDMTDETRLRDTINQFKPSIIINAAAITDLHFCESNPSLAFNVNAHAPFLLAKICHEKQIYFVQISTDHFYLDREFKHTESCPITIVNEYAKSKYLGECFALQYPSTLIVRTNIVGFRHWHGKLTFVESLLSKFIKKEHFNLFTDYYTSSIDVEHFSKILFDLIKLRPSGIFNVASAEVFTKKQFIVAFAEKFNFSFRSAQDVRANESLTVKRATNLGLDVAKAEKLLGCSFPNLDSVINNLFNQCERNAYV